MAAQRPIKCILTTTRVRDSVLKTCIEIHNQRSSSRLSWKNRRRDFVGLCPVSVRIVCGLIYNARAVILARVSRRRIRADVRHREKLLIRFMHSHNCAIVLAVSRETRSTASSHDSACSCTRHRSIPHRRHETVSDELCPMTPCLMRLCLIRLCRAPCSHVPGASLH